MRDIIEEKREAQHEETVGDVEMPWRQLRVFKVVHSETGPNIHSQFWNRRYGKVEDAVEAIYLVWSWSWS